MKKVLSGVVFAALASGLLAGCTTATKVPSATVEAASTYGFDTATAVSLLTDVKFANTDGATDPSSEETSSEPVTSETATEEATVDVTRYLGMLEQLLSDHPIQIETVASDVDGYAYMTTVTTTDLNGVTSTYVIYYNEATDTAIETSSETTESSTETTESSTETTEESSAVVNPAIKAEMCPGDGDGENFGDAIPDHYQVAAGSEDYQGFHGHKVGWVDDDQDLTTLSGIAEVGGVTYEVVGETGDNEVRFYIAIDATNWVRIAKTTEDDVTIYSYTVVADGVKTRMRFLISEDVNGTYVTLKEMTDESKYAYKFYKTVDESGNEVIDIIANENGVVTHLKVTVTVDATTGDTTYSYVVLETGHEYQSEGHHEYHNHGDNNQNGHQSGK